MILYLPDKKICHLIDRCSKIIVEKRAIYIYIWLIMEQIENN